MWGLGLECGVGLSSCFSSRAPAVASPKFLGCRRPARSCFVAPTQALPPSLPPRAPVRTFVATARPTSRLGDSGWAVQWRERPDQQWPSPPGRKEDVGAVCVWVGATQPTLYEAPPPPPPSHAGRAANVPGCHLGKGRVPVVGRAGGQQPRAATAVQEEQHRAPSPLSLPYVYHHTTTHRTPTHRKGVVQGAQDRLRT